MPLVARETLRLFPTVVAMYDVDEPALLAHAAEEILARAATLPTVARGERRGWQSAADLLEWTPRIRAVGDLVSEAVSRLAQPAGGELYLSAWANVLRRGDHFTPHTHANTVWSVVLYVDAGDAGVEAGGLLAMRDPRGGAGMVHGPTARHDAADTFEIAPRTGLLVAFPAWLVHWVSPYDGERPRISIAANVR